MDRAYLPALHEDGGLGGVEVLLVLGGVDHRQVHVHLLHHLVRHALAQHLHPHNTPSGSMTAQAGGGSEVRKHHPRIRRKSETFEVASY